MDIEGIDEALVIGIPHTKFGEIAILLYSGKVQLNYRQIKSFNETTFKTRSSIKIKEN